LVACYRRRRKFSFIKVPILDNFKFRDLFLFIIIIVGMFLFRDDLGGQVGKIVGTAAAFYFGLRQPQVK